MEFQQDITWKTVARILALFLMVSVLVLATLSAEIQEGASMFWCWFALFVYLAVCLGAISARLGDFDNDLSTPYGPYLKDYRPQDRLFRYYDPD